jgi:hypothetical protein
MLQELTGAPCLLLALEPEQVGPGLPVSHALASRLDQVAAALTRLAQGHREA